MDGRADPDLPFILVTGTMGEEVAVETLKAGVDDYVLKGNLQRLKKAFEAGAAIFVRIAGTAMAKNGRRSVLTSLTAGLARSPWNRVT